MIVTIDFKNLFSSKNLSALIKNAFGSDGLGIVVVTNIPNFKQQKMELLKLSKQFAELPDNTKKKYESPETKYAFGWSHGKEKLKNNKYDTLKGSFYANPIYDEPSTNKDLIKKYPSNYSKNVWPTKHIPKYRDHFKNIGKIMHSIGLQILKHTDIYLKENINEYPPNYLYDIINKSKTYKARLLHYFPVEKNNLSQDITDNYCGWHLDHGGLTILTKAVYLDNNYNEVPENESSGLYIKDRFEKTHHCVIPENAVLCQIGEILQILSGGYLQATPHCVKTSNMYNITRETFPLFLDCDVTQNIALPKWSTKNVLYNKGISSLKNIPSLKNRYNGCTQYYEFVQNTYKSFYD